MPPKSETNIILRHIEKLLAEFLDKYWTDFVNTQKALCATETTNKVPIHLLRTTMITGPTYEHEFKWKKGVLEIFQRPDGWILLRHIDRNLETLIPPHLVQCMEEKRDI